MSKRRVVSTLVSLAVIAAIELTLGAPIFKDDTLGTDLSDGTPINQITVVMIGASSSLDELRAEIRSQRAIMSKAPKRTAFPETRPATTLLTEGTYELHEFVSLSPTDPAAFTQANLAVITEADVERIAQVAAAPAPLEPLLDIPLDAELQHRVFSEICDNNVMRFCLIMAVAKGESQFGSSQIGDAGDSWGIVQINQQWHLERIKRLGVTDLLDPFQCMLVGMDYLNELMADLHISAPTHRLLMSYNMGSSGASEAYANGQYSNAYSREVMPYYEQFVAEMAEQGYVLD